MKQLFTGAAAAGVLQYTSCSGKGDSFEILEKAVLKLSNKGDMGDEEF